MRDKITERIHPVILVMIKILCIVCMVAGSKSTQVNANSATADSVTGNKILSEGAFSITYEPLLNGSVKWGKSGGVRVTITNSGEPFEGKIRVYKEEEVLQNAVYEKNVIIGAGESITTELYTQVYSATEHNRFELYDSNTKQVVFNQLMQVNYQMVTSIQFGVLSSQPEGLDYLKKEITKVIHLKQETLPMDSRGLSSLDVLIIDQFDTTSLLEEQYAAIKQWVAEGGMLVIGTGEYGNQTLSAFQNDLFTYKARRCYQKEIGFGVQESNVQEISEFDLDEEFMEYGFYTNLGEFVKVNQNITNDEEQESVEESAQNYVLSVPKMVFDMNLIDAKEMVLESGTVLFSGMPYMEGTILIGTVDFNLPNTAWNTLGNQMIKIIISQMGSRKQQDIRSTLAGENGKWQLYNVAQLESSFKVPKASRYLILLLVYIVIIGPVAFYYLYRKNKTSCLWGVIPICAMVFTLFVYMIGDNTRNSGIFGGYVSITYLDDKGNASEEVLVQVNTPDNATYEFDMDPVYRVMYTSSAYSGSSDSRRDQIASDNYAVKISETDERQTIQLQNLSSYTGINLIAERQQIHQGKLITQITNDNNNSSGTIVNETGKEYQCAVLAVGNVVYFLKDFRPGDVVDLQNLKAECCTINSLQYMKVWNTILSTMDGNYVNANSIAQIMEYIGNIYQSGYALQKGVFIGIVQEDSTTGFSSYSDIELSGKEMVISEFEYLESTTKDQKELSRYMTEVDSKNYYYMAGSIIANSPSFAVKYELPWRTMELWNAHNPVSSEFIPYDIITAYNYTTGQFEPIFEQDQMTIEELKSYLNPRNEMILQYQNSSSYQEYGDYVVPNITIVKERNKDVKSH